MIIKTTKNAGFSLIELSIVVIIGGLLLTAFADAFLNTQRQAKIKTTQSRLEAVDEALRNYAFVNSRLPCAASLSQPNDTATYGIEVSTTCNTANAGTFRPGGTVRIGSVPTRSLNLPDSYGYDAWGGRLLYAVTENLTNSATYVAGTGTIGMIDSAGNSVITPPNTLDYVLVSHGEDQEGAYNFSGILKNPCAVGQNDTENCNNTDAIFRNTFLVSTGTAANNFDDVVSYKGSSLGSDVPSGAVMAFNLATCPSGWVAIPNSAGRVVVGTGTLGATGTRPTGGSSTYTMPPLTLGMTGGYEYFYGPSNYIAPNDFQHEALPPYMAFLYCQKV